MTPIIAILTIVILMVNATALVAYDAWYRHDRKMLGQEHERELAELRVRHNREVNWLLSSRHDCGASKHLLRINGTGYVAPIYLPFARFTGLPVGMEIKSVEVYDPDSGYGETINLPQTLLVTPDINDVYVRLQTQLKP